MYQMTRWRFLLTTGSIVGCMFVFLFFTTYVRPHVEQQLHCTTVPSCELTLKNDGGGFDRGFNPTYSWSAKPAAGIQFVPTSGTLRAGQSIQIHILIEPHTCPAEIAFSDEQGRGESGYSPFTLNNQTGQCELLEPDMR
jgi:hypothetical protein